MSRRPKIFSLGIAFLCMFCQMLTGVGPAGAHFTDPPHSPWMVDVQDTEGFPGENYLLEVSSKYTASQPGEYTTLQRLYDIVFPADTTVHYVTLGSGGCSIEGPIVHCGTAVDFFPDGGGDAFVINASTDAPDGTYEVTVTTSTHIGATLVTDTDVAALHLVSRVISDLEVKPPSVRTLEVSVPFVLSYEVTNHGPAPASDVRFEAAIDWFLGDISAPECEPGLGWILCNVGTLEVGETTKLDITLTPSAVPQVEDSSMLVRANAFAFFGADPNSDNNFADLFFPTHCAYFVDPSSVVDPTASVARKGCTYVGPRVTVGAHAVLEKSAYVTGTDETSTVGAFARIGTSSILIGSMGEKSSIGARSRVRGSIGESATIGDRVLAETYPVVVESKASIGNDSRVELDFFGQTVTVRAGSKIPKGTVISNAYCQSNAAICIIS